MAAPSREVGFPFGHGLSYTTFGYSDLAVTVLGDGLAVEVTVANTGAVAGKEVVQVYVADPSCAVARPPRELKAFAKGSLEPGAAQRVSLRLTWRALSYWSPRHGRLVLECRLFDIAGGAS